jgi:hypothetical protein
MISNLALGMHEFLSDPRLTIAWFWPLRKEVENRNEEDGGWD